MARTNNLSEFLTDVAQSIKDKKGITGKIPAANFDTEISTIETGIDTSDATATAADIKSGSTAYAKDTKLTGTLTFDKFDPDYTNCLNKASQIEGSVPLENPYFVKSLTSQDVKPDNHKSNIRTWITEIPMIDTSKVTDMSSMFSGCTNLTTIPELNMSHATDTFSMFSGCTSLTSVPQLDTSHADNMGNMFEGCKSLKAIPELNTSNARFTSDMFSGCTSLTSIPELNTLSAANMGTMFKGCSNLVTIPLLNTSNATFMHNMFAQCPNLSDESLNNILQMCINSKYTGKTLNSIGLSQEQATKCATLSNWSAFTSAGWTSGY